MLIYGSSKILAGNGPVGLPSRTKALIFSFMTIEIEVLLNLPELEVTDVELTEQKLMVHCRSRLGEALCPSCLQPTKEVKKYYHRTIRDLAITGRDVYLQVEERQFSCPACDRYFSERFSFVAPNRTTTQRYEASLFARCEKTAFSQVAVLENLAWPVVQAISERQAARQLEPVEQVRWLGIDEIALRKGQNHYACVVIDLERACVIELLPGRTQEEVMAYLRQQGAGFCQAIEVFSCDMWDGFVNSAKALLPNATVVIDRFHVMRQLHDAIDKARRALRRKHPDQEVLKRLRWLLLKHPEDLTLDEPARLEQAFAAFPELEQLWQLKEAFRRWYDTIDCPDKADWWLAHWIDQAHALGNRNLDRFVKTLCYWRQSILNFFLQRITNGLVEGINNIIKAIKRRAFGFMNFAHFRLRVLLECH